MSYQKLSKEQLVSLLSEKDKEIERLQWLANIDYVTGLLNKRAGIILLRDNLKKSDLRKKNLTVCFLDIDNFKQINDNYGHVEGDKFLRQIGKLLKENVRDSDFVTRIGGDEFLIIFPQTTIEEANLVWERISRDIAITNKRKIFPCPLSLSYGFAEYNCHQDLSINDLIKRADKEMYQRKNLL